jgi:hypothetical protein
MPRSTLSLIQIQTSIHFELCPRMPQCELARTVKAIVPHLADSGATVATLVGISEVAHRATTLAVEA